MKKENIEYKVFIDDVFHLFEPEEYRLEYPKTFKTYEEAIEVCKSLMDGFIADYGEDLDQIASAYQLHGIDPWIDSVPDNHEIFSSRTYYEQRVAQLKKDIISSKSIKNVSKDNIKNLIQSSEQLVKERIKGTRKGSDTPAYEHSLNVYKLLQEFKFSDEVCLAGLLHDIVEDGDTSFDDLAQLGFPERVIRLVELCTHNETIEDKNDRWLAMMVKIRQNRDPEAMAIKVADLIDNLSSCHTMSRERRMNMRLMKAPALLQLSADMMKGSGLWLKLSEVATKGLNQEADAEFSDFLDDQTLKIIEANNKEEQEISKKLGLSE